ncbi:hypothetical protein [Tomitella gaofuii]|uniref:hypothetical protein n=1 Tax=Tomitella gaofuii TaxID=2760083 RepID=UPI0015FE6E9D
MPKPYPKEFRDDVVRAARNRVPGAPARAELNWDAPTELGTLYENIIKPAYRAVGLPEGTRLHDLRHAFATMQLSVGVHFMQVSQWLGHGTYTLTLDTYGDYVPARDGGAANTLPEPSAATRPEPQPQGQTEPSNVVSLFGRKWG